MRILPIWRARKKCVSYLKNGAMWSQLEAIDLCRLIEDICPEYGCHVGLTGGLLYKSGDRKDADIIFYRIRQVTEIDVGGLMDRLAADLAIVPGEDHGWCYKATWHGKPIDFFFPERAGVDAPGYEGPQSLGGKKIASSVLGYITF